MEHIKEEILKTFFWIPNQAGDEEGRKIIAFAGTTREGDESDGFQPSLE